jgi:hypothetical protein
MFGAKVRVHRRTVLHVDDIAARLRGPTKVKVGFPAGKVESDIIARAVFNEFGTGRIPERPFMRNAMRANRSKYNGAMGKAARSVLNGSTSLDGVLSKLGALAQGDIQEEIRDLDTPPNAPSTIERKGSSNPLIDTGEMRQKVTWKVGE